MEQELLSFHEDLRKQRESIENVRKELDLTNRKYHNVVEEFADYKKNVETVEHQSRTDIMDKISQLHQENLKLSERLQTLVLEKEELMKDKNVSFIL